MTTPRTSETDDLAFTAIGTLASEVAVRLPGLAYLAPDGVLDVPVERSRVVGVRLELPPGKFLHVQSIGLTAGDAEDLTAVATVTASSWYGTYRERFDLARLLDFDDPTGTVVHTEADRPAWVEVRFARPVRLTRIRLRNVPIATARRAGGIVVSVITTLRRRHVVYDGRADLHELDQLLGSVRPTADTNPLLAALMPALADALRGDYPAAVRALASSDGVDEADHRRFREALNAHLLAARQREWTAHGPQRTFRFWSVGEQERYVREAVELVDDLRPLSPSVTFGFGSVLAAVRDGGLIPHDDDLDLVIGFEPGQAPTLADALALVTAHLTDRGYLVTGRFSAHRHVRRPGRPWIDVFVGIFEGETISWYPGARGSLTRSSMFPTATVDMLGVACPAPARPVDYLETVYGPRWRVPDPEFAHTWDRTAYADIAGGQPQG